MSVRCSQDYGHAARSAAPPATAAANAAPGSTAAPKPSTSTRLIALGGGVAVAATAFAIAGFPAGLSFTARSGEAIDIAYHATVLPLLLAGLVTLARMRAVMSIQSPSRLRGNSTLAGDSEGEAGRLPIPPEAATLARGGHDVIATVAASRLTRARRNAR